MNDAFFNKLRESFTHFRNLLESRIENNIPSYKDNDCYLIDNKWYNELEKIFKDYENSNYKNREQKMSFPQQFPDFIYDINKAIELFKSNNEPELISKKVLDSIYKEKNLKVHI